MKRSGERSFRPHHFLPKNPRNTLRFIRCVNGGVTFRDTIIQVSGTVSGAETRYLLSAKTYSPATHRLLEACLCQQVVARKGHARSIEAGGFTVGLWLRWPSLQYSKTQI